MSSPLSTRPPVDDELPSNAEQVFDAGHEQKPPLPGDDPRHGTTRGFHQGCRCAPCRAAIAAYEKRGRWHRHNGIPRAVPAIGSQRRIQALMVLGWTSEDLAKEGGWHSRNAVLRILHGQNGRPCNWVERSTHDRVFNLYERLCMTVPEMTGYRRRRRTIAINKGWHPPLAWDDIDNDPQPATVRDEKRRTIDDFEDLVSLGETPEIAAERLGIQLESIQTARRRKVA